MRRFIVWFEKSSKSKHMLMHFWACRIAVPEKSSVFLFPINQTEKEMANRCFSSISVASIRRLSSINSSLAMAAVFHHIAKGQNYTSLCSIINRSFNSVSRPIDLKPFKNPFQGNSLSWMWMMRKFAYLCLGTFSQQPNRRLSSGVGISVPLVIGNYAGVEVWRNTAQWRA